MNPMKIAISETNIRRRSSRRCSVRVIRPSSALVGCCPRSSDGPEPEREREKSAIEGVSGRRGGRQRLGPDACRHFSVCVGGVVGSDVGDGADGSVAGGLDVDGGSCCGGWLCACGDCWVPDVPDFPDVASSSSSFIRPLVSALKMRSARPVPRATSGSFSAAEEQQDDKHDDDDLGRADAAEGGHRGVETGCCRRHEDLFVLIIGVLRSALRRISSYAVTLRGPAAAPDFTTCTGPTPPGLAPALPGPPRPVRRPWPLPRAGAQVAAAIPGR